MNQKDLETLECYVANLLAGEPKYKAYMASHPASSEEAAKKNAYAYHAKNEKTISKMYKAEGVKFVPMAMRAIQRILESGESETAVAKMAQWVMKDFGGLVPEQLVTHEHTVKAQDDDSIDARIKELLKLTGGKKDDQPTLQ